MKTHNFNDSIQVGKDGEKTVRRYLEGRPNVRQYEDVSNDEEYQGKDIDGLLHMLGGHVRKIEIKTDTYTTGNIFYETKSCVEFDTLGCMEKTEAEYLYYYLPNFSVMYIIKMEKYRKWFRLHRHMFAFKTFKNVKKSGNGTYHSAGYCIPMKYLEAKFSGKYWKKVDMSAWQRTVA